MALPSGYSKDPGHYAPSGIVVGLMPSSQTGFGVELQRTSDVGGGSPASSAALSIAELDPLPHTGGDFADFLPLDNLYRFYRARHISDGTDPGSWTAWTSATRPTSLGLDRPYRVSEGVARIGQFTLTGRTPGGREVPTNLFVSSSGDIIVGTEATTGARPKTNFIDAAHFLPRDETYAWAFNGGSLTPNSTGTLKGFIPIRLPNAVTVRDVRLVVYVSTAAAAQQFQLQENGSTSGITILDDYLIGGSTQPWQIVSSSTPLNYTLSSGKTLMLEVLTLSAAPSTTFTNAQFGRIEVDYDMPAYGRAL